MRPIQVLLFAGLKPVCYLEKRGEAKLRQRVDHAVGGFKANHLEKETLWKRDLLTASFSVMNRAGITGGSNT